MYLYFDKQGTLKEQINNDILRAGNSEVNDIYVFWEGQSDVDIIGSTHQYIDEDGTESVVYNDYTLVNEEIPFNKKQDLKFFKYYKTYPFYKFTVEDGILETASAYIGIIQFSTISKIYTMGAFAFQVNGATHNVEYDKWVTIAQWNYLVKRLGEAKSSALWGQITGTLSNQTDLQNALNTKLEGVKDFSGNDLPINNKKVQINKSAVGLSNVDNTSDLNKPISNDTQNALNDKANQSDLEETQDNLQSINESTQAQLNENVSVKLVGDNFSVDGDTVSFTTRFKNLKTGATTTHTENIALADSDNAGMMSPADYQQLQENTSRIEALEGVPFRLRYTAKDNPTATEINQFVIDSGYTPNSSISVLVAGTKHLWRYYENTGWADDGVDTVTQFTNLNPGIIKGSTSDGQIYAESNGTGSVNGWSTLKTKVENAETKLAGIEEGAEVNEIDTIQAGTNISVSKSGKTVTISAEISGGEGIPEYTGNINNLRAGLSTFIPLYHIDRSQATGSFPSFVGNNDFLLYLQKSEDGTSVQTVVIGNRIAIREEIAFFGYGAWREFYIDNKVVDNFILFNPNPTPSTSGSIKSNTGIIVKTGYDKYYLKGQWTINKVRSYQGMRIQQTVHVDSFDAGSGYTNENVRFSISYSIEGYPSSEPRENVFLIPDHGLLGRPLIAPYSGKDGDTLPNTYTIDLGSEYQEVSEDFCKWFLASATTNDESNYIEADNDCYAIAVYNPETNQVELGQGYIDNDGVFHFNEGSNQAIATRDNTIENNHLVKWDNTAKKLVDAGIEPEPTIITDLTSTTKLLERHINNTRYVFGTLTSLSIAGAWVGNTPKDGYSFVINFISGSTPTTLSLEPNMFLVQNPTINANKFVEMSCEYKASIGKIVVLIAETDYTGV